MFYDEKLTTTGRGLVSRQLITHLSQTPCQNAAASHDQRYLWTI
jgi:hypothetical protein